MTIEEVPAGSMPDWLKKHIRLQSLGKPSNDSNHHGRILIIYPTEKSRRQSLSSIELRGAVDRTLHHTMDSLISSLVADLRLPRVISNQGPLSAIIHAECQKESSRLIPDDQPATRDEVGQGQDRGTSKPPSPPFQELLRGGKDPEYPHPEVITRLEETSIHTPGHGMRTDHRCSGRWEHTIHYFGHRWDNHARPLASDEQISHSDLCPSKD